MVEAVVLLEGKPKIVSFHPQGFALRLPPIDLAKKVGFCLDGRGLSCVFIEQNTKS